MKVVSPIKQAESLCYFQRVLQTAMDEYVVEEWERKMFGWKKPEDTAVEAADWVHLGHETGVIEAWKQCETVLTFSGLLEQESAGKGRKARDMKKLLANATAVTAVSEVVAEDVRQRFVTNREIEVIPNGVDCDVFYPLGMLTEKRSGEVKVLTVSESPEQDIPLFRSLLDKLSTRYEIVCLCDKTSCERRKQVGSRLELYPIPEDESALAEVYRNGSLFFAWDKKLAFSKYVLQAMASGLGVAAPDVPCFGELIREGLGGCLFAEGDAISAAGGISEVAETPDLFETFGQFNREEALLKYDLSKMIAKYRTVFGSR
jgi:glycosyltransferase involved in cell wall biosynthesis